MSNTQSFIESAKAQLDKLGQGIEAFEAKANSAMDGADSWVADKAEKLRRDWSDAKTHVETMVDQERDLAKDGWDKAKTDAQRQWNALQEAIKTYRAHVDDDATAVVAPTDDSETQEAAR